MVPELSFENLEIGKGDQARMAWGDIINDDMIESEIKKTKKALLKYCKLDTLGMVMIFHKFKNILRNYK